MTKKSGKIFLVAILLILAIGLVAAYRIWNKPHKNVEDAAAITVTATELYNSFIKDSAKANELYTNKVVQVSGEVSQVSVNQQAQQVVLLKTAVEEAFINCTVEGKKVNAKAGDKISIKGICSGYISGDIDMGLLGDVFLIRSYPF